VGARHRDAVLEAHELGQHLGARDDGDAEALGFLHLRVVGRNGGGHDRHVGAPDVLGPVAEGDAGPARPQEVGHLGGLEVGPGDGVAHGLEHRGDAAHAGAADADEMDALDGAQGAADPCALRRSVLFTCRHLS